jgi:hypothetical protein
MTYKVRRVAYYNATITDRPGSAYKVLAAMSELGVNLLATTAVPVGPDRTQLSLFPDDNGQLERVAERAGIALDGPHPALLVQGDDKMSALVDVHNKLYEADVNVYAASGVASGTGSYGYILYVRPDRIQRAAEALGI